MNSKKYNTRFTIQFSDIDPDHLEVVDILNKLKHRGKAQYIVNAVKQYENGVAAADTERPSRFDEKVIEAVVNRLMLDREFVAQSKPDAAVSAKQGEEQTLPFEEIDFDDALEALGEDGLKAVAGALEMFRSK